MVQLCNEYGKLIMFIQFVFHKKIPITKRKIVRFFYFYHLHSKFKSSDSSLLTKDKNCGTKTFNKLSYL